MSSRQFYRHTDGSGKTATAPAGGNGQPFQKEHARATVNIEFDVYRRGFSKNSSDFSILLQSENALQILLVDGPGHGESASVQEYRGNVERSLGAIRELMWKNVTNPAKLIADIELYLRTESGFAQMAEVFPMAFTYVSIDFENGLLTSIISGNPPLAHYDAKTKSASAYLPGENFSAPLMEFDHEFFVKNIVVNTTKFSAGDIVLISTDGLNTAIEPNALQAGQPLLSLMEANSDKSPLEIRDEIFTQLLSGKEPDDDITLIGLKRPKSHLP
jgi:serine phosphatase RsbU (regulator of sigma subunit)